MSGDKAKRKNPGSSEQCTVASKEITSLSLLEHYLYGKNVVHAVDMQNIQKQRTTDDETAIGRNNNNGISCLSEGTVPKQ